MRKPKLSVPQQIQHMEDSGICFRIVTKADATRFLQYNTYYFKIKAYAKNFSKYLKEENKKGTYLNLDFAYLQDLSTIDAHLRKFIIRTTLDLEHFLKVKLLQDFGLFAEEDGYTIVEQFLEAHPHIKDNIIAKEKNSNCIELIEKYKDAFAIWNIVEVLSFGDFIALYSIFYTLHPCKDSFVDMLMPIKWLRNAAAHNNCLINNMPAPFAREIAPGYTINRFISNVPGLSAKSRVKKMANPVIHDFVAMLYVATKVITSKRTLDKMFEDLNYLVYERMSKNKEYYEKNEVLLSSYNFVKKVVDFLNANRI